MNDFSAVINQRILDVAVEKLEELKRDKDLFLFNGGKLEIEEAVISVPPHRVSVFALIKTHPDGRREILQSGDGLYHIISDALDLIVKDIIDRIVGI